MSNHKSFSLTIFFSTKFFKILLANHYFLGVNGFKNMNIYSKSSFQSLYHYISRFIFLSLYHFNFHSNANEFFFINFRYELMKVLSTLVVISVSTYLFLAVILPIGVVYYFVQRFYVATSRQLKRLESVSRSPIYSHFGESIQGAPTIRAYSVQQRYIE